MIWGGGVDEFLNNPYVDTAISLIPIVGTLKSGYDLVKDPSLENLKNLGISLITEIPLLKAAKLAKIAKTTKAVKNSAKTTSKAIKRSKGSANSAINKLRLLEHINFVEAANKALNKELKTMQAVEIGSGAAADLGYSIYKHKENF